MFKNKHFCTSTLVCNCHKEKYDSNDLLHETGEFFWEVKIICNTHTNAIVLLIAYLTFSKMTLVAPMWHKLHD